MLRLMAAVEPEAPIVTVGEVPESGAVPTAAGAEAARLTLSERLPASAAKVATAAMPVSSQRAPPQPAAHLRAAPRHRALVSPRALNTVLTDRFEYSFESALYCNSYEKV
jgi:hypothetical protein